MSTLEATRDRHSSALDTVAGDLSFPTGMTFSDDGTLYVVESGLPWGGATPGGRVWRVDGEGRCSLLVGGLRHPATGIVWHAGALYVSEGGCPGRISRITSDGSRDTLLDGLPGGGNYHTNMAVIGSEGKLYFSQGAMTNSGIVGLDAYELGWLGRLPHQHDIPGFEIRLAGVNVRTRNPIAQHDEEVVETGAFVPFAEKTRPGQRIPASVPCTAAIMRCNIDGSSLELVAWGLRNAFGLGCLPDGRILAVDQGLDDRGSRPVGSAPDLLFEVRDGAWYGWPDFIGAEPVTHSAYVPSRGAPPAFLLENHHELPNPQTPLLRLPAHCAATKFDVFPDVYSSWAGHLCLALFGDERPMTAPNGPRVGRRLVRVDTGSWSIHSLSTAPLRRPIDARFHPMDHDLYLLDFGEFEMGGPAGMRAVAGTGRIHKIPREVLLDQQ